MIYSESLSPIGSFLVLALKRELLPDEKESFIALYRRFGQDYCRAASKENQIEALVGSSLQRLLGNDSISADWNQSVIANQTRVLRLIEALTDIVQRLEREGCPSACIEAGGAMLASELAPEAYCPGDIDLLVTASHWDTVQRCFHEAGFRPKDRRGLPTYRIEYHRTLPSGEQQWLEVGCRPFDRLWIPLSFEPPVDEWVAGRVQSPKYNNLYVLAPTDLLLQVAIHTSLHSYIKEPGLRLHIDVDRVAWDSAIDWSALVSQARAMGCQARVFMSLSMAKGLLKTPIPQEILTALYPGHFRFEALQWLLSSEGVIRTSWPKLRHGKALLLDRLLDERPAGKWMSDILFPNEDWLRVHYERKSARRDPLWKLRTQRLIRMGLGR